MKALDESTTRVVLKNYRCLNEDNQIFSESYKTNQPSYLKGNTNSINSCAIEESIIYHNKNNNSQFIIVWNKLRYEVDETVASAINYAKNIFNSNHHDSKTSSKIHQPISTTTKLHGSDNDHLEESKIKQLGNILSLNNRRLVFDDLNGYVQSGEIFAILGPSGVGKTSLLKALIDNNSQSDQKYLVTNGRCVKKSITMSFSPQHDNLNEVLTVKECLLFASRIKNIQDGFDHETCVQRISESLNLTHCLDTRCSAISGGEYKRTAIGQELVKKPDLLLLDEPTTGLDSYNSKKLILYLKQLIKESHNDNNSPMSIILSIHQPGPEVFLSFDRVYIMGDQGRVIYDGPPATAIDKVATLVGECSTKLASDCKRLLSGDKTISPATLLIELASDVYGQRPIEILSDHQRDQFSDELERGKSIKLTGNKGSPENMIDVEHTSENYNITKLNFHNDIGTHYWYKLKLLVKRDFRIMLRNPKFIAYSVTYYILMGIVAWIAHTPDSGSHNICPVVLRDLYLSNMVDNSVTNFILTRQAELESMMGNWTTLIIISLAYSGCATVISVLTFPQRMETLIREVRNGWYKPSGFIVATLCLSLIRDALLPMMGFMLAYRLTEHPISYLEWRMITIGALVGIVAFISGVSGLIIGGILMEYPAAATILCFLTQTPQVAIAGWLLRIKDMNAWIQYVSWLSHYRLGQSLMFIVRYGYGLCPCNKDLEMYINKLEPHFLDLPDTVENVISYFSAQNNLNATTTLSYLDDDNGPLVIETDTESPSMDHFFTFLAGRYVNYVNIGYDIHNGVDSYNTCENYRSIALVINGKHESQVPTYLMGLIFYCTLVITILIYTISGQIRRMT